MNSSSISKADRAHMLHPWAPLTVPEPQLATGTDPAMREGGVHVTIDGRSLLDGVGGLWCVNVGYNRPAIGAAMQAQAGHLPYASLFGRSTTEPAVRLAERLANHAPGDLRRMIFSTGGSTANEAALAFVRLYWTRLGKPDRTIILSRQDSYHGSTYLTAAISARFSDDHRPPRPDEVQLLPSLRAQPGETEAARCARAVEAFRTRVSELGAERIAAFIAEPVQASGGVIVPPDGYLPQVRAICADAGIVYISDEVVTGFGRLGPVFASEKVFGIVPDILTVAKGLTSGYAPLGATLVSDRLLAAADQDGTAYFGQGFTYSGHPVSCAAALANLDILESEGLGANAVARGAQLHEGLARLAADFPIVADVRGMSLLAAVQLHDRNGRPSGQALSDAVRAHGAIARPLGDSIVLSPPLSITADEVDSLLRSLRAGLADISAG